MYNKTWGRGKTTASVYNKVGVVVNDYSKCIQ